MTIWIFGTNLYKKGTPEQNNQSNKLQAFASEIGYLLLPRLVLPESSSGWGMGGKEWGGVKKALYQLFPCNFFKPKNYPPL